MTPCYKGKKRRKKRRQNVDNGKEVEFFGKLLMSQVLFAGTSSTIYTRIPTQPATFIQL